MTKTLLLGLAIMIVIGQPAVADEIDDGVIRLAPARDAAAGDDVVQVEAPRQGFDYEAFEARIESLWFQRKTLVSSGRFDDSTEQLEKIRAFSAEEGVQRLEHMAGALVAEAHRYYKDGKYDRALVALQYAGEFDPDRPQTYLLQAATHWSGSYDVVATGRDLLAAMRAAVARSVRQLVLFPRLAFLLGISLLGTVLVFSTLMLIRHQVALRHEVQEALCSRVGLRVAGAVGWAVLALPFMLWVGAGWIAIYWLLITFRFMARAERAATVGILLLVALTLPAYRVSVGLFSTAADPAVRTTLLAAEGEYDPDRIVRLRRLVHAHPDDPAYRFLLAGLYKNGRYFEEAFREYKEALVLDSDMVEARINIGNIFYATGQHGEASANYARAIKMSPDSYLAHFNNHLAQSEDFRFAAAEESLRAALALDADSVSAMLADSGSERPEAADAQLELPWVWQAALGGRDRVQGDDPDMAVAGPLSGAGGPIAWISLLAILGCVAVGVVGSSSEPARRCIRCGRPFCGLCKSSREAREYCTQCLHLFVLGDGLAPGIKQRKLYEVERQERRARLLKSLGALFLPGTAHVLRGRPARGLLLMGLWLGSLIALWPSALGAVARTVGLELRPEIVAGNDAVPAVFAAQPLGLIALFGLPLLWILGNVWRLRRRREG